MPQVVKIGIGGDYSTVASWVASSDYSTDWGVGNPATGQITGKITENVTINTAATPNGALLTAFPGEEYDGTNSATCAGLIGSGVVLAIRDNGIEVSNIFTRGTGLGVITVRLGAFEAVDTNYHDCGTCSELTNANSSAIETWSGGAFTGNIEKVIVEESGGYGLWLKWIASGTIDHITVLDAAASGSSFRNGIKSDNSANIVTNSLSLMATTATGASFAGSFNAASDFNAGEDASAPGSNSLDNRTTADLANYAGGDFRTASASALATAGSSGGFIGAFLESGGAPITITPDEVNTSSVSLDPTIAFNATLELAPLAVNTDSISLDPTILFSATLELTPLEVNTDSVSLNPSIEFNSTLELLPTQVNSSSISLDPIIDFTSALSLNPGETNSSSIALNPTILFTGLIELNPDAVNSSSVSLDPLIQFSASLNLSPDTVDSLSIALNPIIEYTSALVINPQEVNTSSISLDPTIKFISVINLLPETVNSLSISLNPIITTGEQQIIGIVTAGFKDDQISVKYKISGITVNFKE